MSQVSRLIFSRPAEPNLIKGLVKPQHMATMNQSSYDIKYFQPNTNPIACSRD